MFLWGAVGIGEAHDNGHFGTRNIDSLVYLLSLTTNTNPAHVPSISYFVDIV